MTTVTDSLTREQFREMVRDRTDILTLVGRSTQLPPHLNRRTVMCKCPFHADNGPSLAVYPDQGRWHCFGGCSMGGDAFEWVMKRDNVDFPEALHTLARDAGLDVPDWRDEPDDKRAEREEAQKLLNFVARFYHARLLDPKLGGPQREYLISRGFGEDTWKRWMLGAAGGDNELLKMMRRRKLNVGLASKIGLLWTSEDGNFTKDRFQNRVMIPFLENGRVSFMTGRRIDAEKEAKYLHLHNSDLFQKVPYNWRERGETLVIVEGALDVWAVEALGDDDVSAMALMGLYEGNFALDKALKHRKRIYLGLDADGTVKDEVKLALLTKLGPETRLVTWPDDDDPAAWLKRGATPEDFAALLESSPTWMDHAINAVRNAPPDDRAFRVEDAIKIAAMLPPAQGDLKIAEIKKAAKGITAETIKALVKAARGANEPAATNGNGHHAAEKKDDAPKLPLYYELDGELWYGRDPAKQITSGGTARYAEIVHVDDGEDEVQQLTIRVTLKEGTVLDTPILSEKSADSGEVAAAIKKVAGPKFTILAYQRAHLAQAMEQVSRQIGWTERTEIARTGWVENADGELAFVTPGGVVGTLPDGVTVKLPLPGLERFAVKDDGDEAFAEGIDGVVNGLLKAFDEHITMPLLAFALIPPAVRWIPEARKFALHLVGDTGALKTETAKLAMCLYGNFAGRVPPLANWLSTVNSIERLGFWLPDVMGFVDDYKPITVQKWDFVGLLQRYADENDRTRLARDATLRQRKGMRWWLLSTGQDIPDSEASVLARMVAIRFPQRPEGKAMNHELRYAERKAKFFPTVMARWIAYLRDENGAGLSALFIQRQESIGNQIQKHSPKTVNLGRVSNNIALMWAVWEGFQDFLSIHAATHKVSGFGMAAGVVGAAQARLIASEKPTAVFLDALQQGLDAGRFKAVARNSKNAHEAGGENFVGFFDNEGFYLLGAAYNFVSKWMREAGRGFGFTEQEFRRLLKDEGLLVATGKTETMRSVRVGENAVNTKVVKALWLKPELISTPLVQRPADV